MITLLLHLFRLLPFLFGGCRQLAVENLASRQQLSVYKRTTTRPKLRTTDRLFWVGLARVWAGWRQSLVIVTPDTVSRSKTRVRRPDVEFRPAVHPSPLDAGVVDRNVDASQVVPAALQVHGRARGGNDRPREGDKRHLHPRRRPHRDLRPGDGLLSTRSASNCRSSTSPPERPAGRAILSRRGSW
jgi:hypothetical protein